MVWYTNTLSRYYFAHTCVIYVSNIRPVSFNNFYSIVLIPQKILLKSSNTGIFYNEDAYFYFILLLFQNGCKIGNGIMFTRTITDT
jgi:hypothetical protein